MLGKRRDGETEGRALWTEPLIWAAAPGWQAPAGRPLPLAMLPQGCLLRDRALAALVRGGIAAGIVYASASPLGVAAAAQAGFAATILGRSGLPEGLEALMETLARQADAAPAVIETSSFCHRREGIGADAGGLNRAGRIPHPPEGELPWPLPDASP